MATPPPVLFFALTVVFVVEALVIVTSPVVVSSGAVTEADTVGLSWIVAVFEPSPTRPPPEPVDVAEDTPSPIGGEIVARETPPGPVRNCVPSTAGPPV